MWKMWAGGPQQKELQVNKGEQFYNQFTSLCSFLYINCCAVLQATGDGDGDGGGPSMPTHKAPKTANKTPKTVRHDNTLLALF